MPAVNELATTEDNLEIIWRAFELRPEPAPLPDANSDYFKQMWENTIYPLAEKLGVKMDMPTVKPYSRITHEVSKWARSAGNFDKFKDAIFRAYFERNENIGELEILLSITKILKLDADSLLESLQAKEFTGSVIKDELYAEQIGLNTVPAFVANRKNGLTGLQPVENLRRLINAA